jgi:hypothetical protein
MAVRSPILITGKEFCIMSSLQLLGRAKRAATLQSSFHNRPFFVVYDPSVIGIYGAYHVASNWDCDSYYGGAEVIYSTEED